MDLSCGITSAGTQWLRYCKNKNEAHISNR